MPILRVVRQGIEWGAAYVEAEPRKVIPTNPDSGLEGFEFHVNESYEIQVEFPPHATIEFTGGRIVVTIPQNC